MDCCVIFEKILNTLLEKESEICGFKTYQFRSSNGYGKTSIFELGSRATISFSDHLYYNDFEYAVLSEDSVVIHQYDSILTDNRFRILQENVIADIVLDNFFIHSVCVVPFRSFPFRRSRRVPVRQGI